MDEVEHPAGHPWARTSVVDVAAVDHERIVGEVSGSGLDVVRVRLAQRVDFDLIAEPVRRITHPPRITLGETFELTAQQALLLARHLREAADLAARIDDRPRP